MTPRKLLILTTSLNQGGAEALLVDFASTARANGWTVKVMSLLPGGEHRPVLEAAGFAVIDAGLQRGKTSSSRLLKALAQTWRDESEVVQCWMYHANLVGAVARMLSPCRRRPTFFGIFNSMIDFSAYNPRTYRVFRTGARLSSRVDGVVYNSMRAARDHEIAGYCADRSIVIGNGINLNRFKPNPEARHGIREELGIPSDAKVVAIAARNDPQKDWSTTLDAVRRMNGPIVLAAGLGTENLPETPNLIRLGARKDIERIYAAADAFMLVSSFGEGTSVAMCEAMGCGLPVIVTDVGDNAAMVADGVGRVVPIGDVDAMVDAARAILNDPSQRQRMSQLAIERIRKTCEPRVAFAPLLSAYERALEIEGASTRITSESHGS